MHSIRVKQLLTASVTISFFLFIFINNSTKTGQLGPAEQALVRNIELRQANYDSPVSVYNKTTIQPSLDVSGPQGIPKLDREFVKKYQLRGMVFSSNTTMGDLAQEISNSITISVVKTFSPQVENHVKEIFNDEYKECKFFATIPAMLKRNGRIKVIQRIWLAQYERLRTQFKKEGRSEDDMAKQWRNTWQENFLYEMELDNNYNLVRPGNIMGLPTTTNVIYTYKSDGPMDPRMFRIGNNEYLSFHTWLVDPTWNNMIAGRPHLYDLNKHIKRRLTIDIPMQRAEINWIPLDIEGELYFTYSLDPLRVMKCNSTTGSCKFIYQQPGYSNHPFVYSSDHLRGGTPWLLYKYPYYISLGHNVVVTSKPANGYTVYNANIIVMRVKPWQIVYVSRILQFNDDWLKSQPVIRNHTILYPFFYPTGIIQLDDDTLDVSGHLNDATGHILRLTGIKDLMERVIKIDQQNTNQIAEVGIRTVQQYLIDSIKASFNYTWTFQGDIIAGTVEKPQH